MNMGQKGSWTMRNKSRYKRFAAVLMVLLFMLPSMMAVRAEMLPAVQASSYILYEPDRDLVLFEKDAEQRIFPASMTKILTAILVEEYIAPDEIVIVGSEILNIPSDSSLANHKVGDAISGENLLRGLIIPSGNETACIVAMHVARKVSGDANMTYADAEQYFCNMMNEKAKEFGAKDTNFTNPHGYHAATHYTTAYDLALITREAMKSALISRIATETLYVGPSAIVAVDSGLQITNHNWPTHNKLIQDGAEGYAYATGLKTGYTEPAGECLAATAEKDGRRLIVIVCNSPSEARWVDAKNLFEYGFTQFADRVLLEEGQLMGSVEMANPQLGDEMSLEYFAAEGFSAFLSEEQFANVTCEVAVDPMRIVVNPPDAETGEPDDVQRIAPPIAEGEEIGTVTYSVAGEVLFTGALVAGRSVEARTFNSDVDHYMKIVFSTSAIPYWIVGVLLLAAVVVVIVILVRRGGGRRNGRYHFQKRRW